MGGSLYLDLVYLFMYIHVAVIPLLVIGFRLVAGVAVAVGVAVSKN